MWEFIEAWKEQMVTIVALVTALIAIYNWVGKPVQKIVKRDKQQNDDLAVLTWAFLQDAHDKYVKQGWCTPAEKEQLLSMHRSYIAKGRNHLSELYRDDIMKLPEKPVTAIRQEIKRRRSENGKTEN